MALTFGAMCERSAFRDCWLMYLSRPWCVLLYRAKKSDFASLEAQHEELTRERDQQTVEMATLRESSAAELSTVRATCVFLKGLKPGYLSPIVPDSCNRCVVSAAVCGYAYKYYSGYLYTRVGV